MNTEPCSEELASSYITPNELVFNRNHDSAVSATEHHSTEVGWSIDISVEDDQALSSIHVTQPSLPLESLKANYEKVEVVATLECAGNRRAELASSHQPAEGIQWGDAVIANVIWGGASLRSVLLAAGIPDPFCHHSDLTSLKPSAEASLADAASWAHSLHLHIYSAQESSESDDPTRKEVFAASIPLVTALHPNQNCLLSYEYNRTPLTQRHGAPLRAVIPGHVGARWVKWLNGLKISARENDSPPMRQDYKLLVPHAQSEEKDFADKAANGSEFRKQQLHQKKPLQQLAASCSVTLPRNDAQAVQVTKERTIEVKGYAVGQDGCPATKVYVALIPEAEASTEEVLVSLSADLVWKQAEFHTQDPSNWSWAWTLWHVQLPAPRHADQKWILIARCGKYFPCRTNPMNNDH